MKKLYQYMEQLDAHVLMAVVAFNVFENRETVDKSVRKTRDCIAKILGVSPLECKKSLDRLVALNALYTYKSYTDGATLYSPTDFGFKKINYLYIGDRV